jgi:predicted DNA-binding transcriptional regulator AlpA
MARANHPAALLGRSPVALPNSLIPLINEYELAQMLGVSVATVRRWRLLKQGPRVLKLGVLCRYRIEDVTAWLETRPTGGHQAEA